MATYALTYDVITPESAAEGEFAESGFEREPTPIKRTRIYSRLREDCIGLREAIDDAREHGCTAPSDGHRLEHVGAHTWFYDPDGGTECYVTGERTQYAAHFGGVTASTMRRIARLLAK